MFSANSNVCGTPGTIRLSREPRSSSAEALTSFVMARITLSQEGKSLYNRVKGEIIVSNWFFMTPMKLNWSSKGLFKLFMHNSVK